MANPIITHQVNSVRLKTVRGTSMIEFALVLPVLLLLVFAIAEFGVVLYDKAVITNASREAARAGVIYRSPAMTDAQISQVAIDDSAPHLITFGGSVTPTATVSKPSGGTAGNPLTVTVTYQFTGLLFTGDLLAVLSGTQTLSATTTMVIE